MDARNPRDERYLTSEELQDIQATWTTMQAALRPVDEMIRAGGDVDCAGLHDAFVALADVFDDVERIVMRAQQIRLLRAQDPPLPR